MAGKAHRVDGGEGEPFFYLTDILGALERARGEREFLLRVHLGNFALWLGGVGSDLALRHGVGDLFLRAADRFRDVRSALNSLSDTLFFPQSQDAIDRLLRQVSDDFQRQSGWR